MTEQLVKQVKAAFEHEPRVNLHKDDIHLSFHDGVLVLEGEVADIAAKRLAPRLAAGVPGVARVEDRLRVAPAEPRGDGAILDELGAFLLAEPVFRNCTLRESKRGKTEVLHAALEEDCGWLEISAEDGTVFLRGEVISLSHMRLAEVLAWWTPGCRNVVNGIAVEPPEEDTDAEVTDAVVLALEKDPLVHADQMRVSTRDRVVTLEGLARTREERRMAERDAWYVPGVRDVVNRIEVGG